MGWGEGITHPVRAVGWDPAGLTSVFSSPVGRGAGHTSVGTPTTTPNITLIVPHNAKGYLVTLVTLPW